MLELVYIPVLTRPDAERVTSRDGKTLKLILSYSSMEGICVTSSSHDNLFRLL